MNIKVTFEGGPDDGRQAVLWGKWREDRRVHGHSKWDVATQTWRAPVYKLVRLLEGYVLVFTGDFEELSVERPGV